MGEQAMGITKIDAGLYVQTPDPIDLSDLTDDGGTVDLDDGRTLRLRVKPDDIDPFAEFGEDCYGKIAPLQRHEYRVNDAERPEGFNGNAEKLTAGRDTLWWQPPERGPKRGTPEFDKTRQLVRDLIEYGMCIVILELLDSTDGYGRPIVVNVASLGGIDSLADGYLAEVVKDLATELGIIATS